MKRIIFRIILFLPLLTAPIQANVDLDKAIDELNVNSAIWALETNPSVLTESEAIKLITRLLQQQEKEIKHPPLPIAKSLACGGILASCTALLNILLQLESNTLNSSQFLNIGAFTMLAGVLGFGLGLLFFEGKISDEESAKRTILLALLSKPLTKIQLKILGIIKDKPDKLAVSIQN